ncbi:Branched chain amino acid ABC transporter periplasmic ligand-binding protein [Mesorhizobium loti]|nr:Branched chain amino acid ABC transporter periplasmic ligand-binding protein [Mesorhizobium loti]
MAFGLEDSPQHYNGDSTLTALPQALELGAAKSYFLFGVDPGIWKEKQLSADVPVAMSCVPVNSCGSDWKR